MEKKKKRRRRWRSSAKEKEKKEKKEEKKKEEVLSTHPPTHPPFHPTHPPIRESPAAHSNRLVLLYLPINHPPTHPPTHREAQSSSNHAGYAQPQAPSRHDPPVVFGEGDGGKVGGWVDELF